MRYNLLALPAPSGGLPLAPPAPSGGAWGDASPQTPAKRTSWQSGGLEMGDGPRPPLPSIRRICPRPVHTPRLAVRSVAFTIVRPVASTTATALTSTRSTIGHTVFLAGVWGEASPQASPEARWTAGRSRGTSQPWAGGARKEAQAPPEGAKETRGGGQSVIPGEALWDMSRWS